MTIEEIGALANICRELREISVRSSIGSGPNANKKAKLIWAIHEDFLEIFVDACEINRERIKHILKK